MYSIGKVSFYEVPKGGFMVYNEKKKAYNQTYTKEHMKRIPLDVQKEHYDRIKAAADSVGESVNGFIKNAIDMRIFNLDDEKK